MRYRRLAGAALLLAVTGILLYQRTGRPSEPCWTPNLRQRVEDPDAACADAGLFDHYELVVSPSAAATDAGDGTLADEEYDFAGTMTSLSAPPSGTALYLSVFVRGASGDATAGSELQGYQLTVAEP